MRDQLLSTLQRVRVAAAAAAGGGAADAEVEVRIARLAAVLEASDRLVTDPLSAAFGFDDAAIEAAASAPPAGAGAAAAS